LTKLLQLSIQAFEPSTIHLVATGANPIFQEQFATALSNSTTTGLTIILKKLEGKVALVTGCCSGIGLATAKRFVAEGTYVFITGRRQTELDTAVKEIGENVTGVQSDVSNLADLDRRFATIEQEQGHLDVVFANAGSGEFPPLGAITEEHFDKMFNTNVKGLLFTVQKALPLLPEGASIILNASEATTVGNRAARVFIALPKPPCARRGRNWILDLKERKIRVNAISPSVVPTPGYYLHRTE
jgi:NAD(P)-dependent dehydrogenase (short-subunit alcohol dehydrogenase family)